MPGVREVVRKTGCGRLSRVRDSVDLAEKIFDLLEHPCSFSKDFLVDFDLRRTMDKYEQVFTSKLVKNERQ